MSDGEGGGNLQIFIPKGLIKLIIIFYFTL